MISAAVASMSASSANSPGARRPSVRAEFLLLNRRLPNGSPTRVVLRAIFLQLLRHMSTQLADTSGSSAGPSRILSPAGGRTTLGTQGHEFLGGSAFAIRASATRGASGQPMIGSPSVPAIGLTPRLKLSLARLGPLSIGTSLTDRTAESSGRTQTVVVIALAVPAWAALAITAILVRNPLGHTHATASVTVLDALAGELALGAAVVSVLRAWASRELISGFAGVGLFAYGAYKLIVVARPGPTAPGSALQVAGSLSFVLAFGFLFLSVVQPLTSRSSHHPLNGAVAALIAALVGWALADPVGSGMLGSYGGSNATADILLAAAWAALGVTAFHVGRSEGVPLKIWIGFAAFFLAQARVSMIIFTDPGVARLSNAVLATLAVAITLFGTVLSLQESISTTKGMAIESLMALKGSEAQRSREASAHEEAVHNLKSALTSINMATHMLVSDRKVPLTAEQRCGLEAALRSELDRARRLISREWDRGRCSFDLARQLAPLMAAERAQGTLISAAVPKDVTVLANPEQTYEVVATLLDNARRHAPGSVVTVSAVNVAEEVVISVEDRGPGIPPALTEKIFERGWTTSAKGEGMGIGLYLAKKLTEEQGGCLTACNRVGGGACFTITLPAGEMGAQKEEPD